MNARQFASRTAAVVVGGIAAVASFTHMRDLAIANGQTHLIGTLMPVSVDGMIAVATLAIADGRTRKGSAWTAFLIGVAASVTANVLAAPDTILARCISGWPAVALLLVVEVLTRGGRKVPADLPEGQAAILPAKSQVSTDIEAATPRARKSAPKAAKVAAIVRSRPDLATGEAAKLAGVSARTARRVINGHPVLDETTL